MRSFRPVSHDIRAATANQCGKKGMSGVGRLKRSGGGTSSALAGSGLYRVAATMELVTILEKTVSPDCTELEAAQKFLEQAAIENLVRENTTVERKCNISCVKSRVSELAESP
ncbi:putative Importin subunit beta-1 protein [Naja naja]|nr:putative Importin subunit beta-1 protein [Naja naja]